MNLQEITPEKESAIRVVCKDKLKDADLEEPAPVAEFRAIIRQYKEYFNGFIDPKQGSSPSQVSSNVTLSLKELGELRELLLKALKGEQIPEAYTNIMNGTGQFKPFAPLLKKAREDLKLKSEFECVIFIDLYLFPYTNDPSRAKKNFNTDQPRAPSVANTFRGSQ